MRRDQALFGFGLLQLTALASCGSIPHGLPYGRDPNVNASAINVGAKPNSTGGVVPEGFVSYSIEFASFPDFAGNSSAPNDFSYNLLKSLEAFQGSTPIVRVGGNTQDYYLYDAKQQQALVGIVDPARSPDYPTTITIGPSYFDSYSTWPGTKYVHGFNLAKNGSVGYDSLIATVPLACKALENGKLAYWELGNEPDLYKTSAQGKVRPPTWNEQDYVNEWLNKTRAIKAAMAQACPNLTTDALYQYIAPSFAGTANSLDPIKTWHDGLDTDHDIALISSHNYIGGATQPGVTLAGTLMNHTMTVSSIAKQLNESNLLANYSIPFILGETNSLYNQGAPGLSNSFGAALWGVDFNLYCAATGIKRVHMHQGTNYRYQAWQPVETNITQKGTKAPYYGQAAVAAFMGNLTEEKLEIQNLPLSKSTEAAYAAYDSDLLKRIMVINMVQYNYSATNVTPAGPIPRPATTYNFTVPTSCAGHGTVSRLLANGSDAITGVTFNGVSYNYELENGKPALMGNVTKDEIVWVGEDGIFQVNVPDSSAAMVNLKCDGGKKWRD